jgi:phage RecT family recombinase
MPAEAPQMQQFLALVEQRRDDAYAALGVLDDVLKKRHVLLAVAAIRNHTHKDGPCRCTALSMWQALIDCCQTELIPDTAEGHAYLIPYVPELHLIVSYKGMIKRVIEAGVADHIYAEVVRQKDFRRFKSGEKRVLIHRFDPFDTKRGDIVGAYSMATLSNGMTDWEAMNLDDIEAIKGAARRTGKGKLSPAWMAFEMEMIKKSALRRHMKRLQGTRRIEGEAANRLAATLNLENKEFNLDPGDYKVVEPGQTDFDTVVDDLNPKRPEPKEEPAVETTARRVRPEPEPPPKEPEPEPEDSFLNEREQQFIEQALANGGWRARDWPKVLKEYVGVESIDQIRASKLAGLVSALEQARKEARP